MLRTTVHRRCLRYFSTHTPVSLNFFNVSENEYKENVIESTHTKQPTPMIVLHGLFGNGQNFKTILSRKDGILAGGRHAYVLDARNHGQSPHAHTLTYHDMTHDLMNFVKHNGIDKCIVMGHSMGGKSVLNMLLHFPEFTHKHVEKAVVVDISPMSYMNHPRWEVQKNIDGLRAVQLDKIKLRKEADEQMKPFVTNEKVRAFLLTNLTKRDGQWKWRFNLDSIQNHLHDVGGFPEITATQPVTTKTLFVRGANSFYVEERQALDLIEKHFADYQVKSVPKAGHWVHVDNTPDFEKIVHEFISQ